MCSQLAKYLLTRSDDSSSAIIERLLATIGPRSPYSREIKGHVVMILVIIAPCIRLEKYPRAIECLCSVVDTSESNELKGDDTAESRRHASKFKDYERVELLEEYHKNYLKYELRIDSPKGTLREKMCQCLPCRWLQHCLLGRRKEVENESKKEENIARDFEWLLIKAVNMIHKLVADEDNRWILRTCVSNTVLHKIARLPIKLHRKSHNPFHRESHNRFGRYDQFELQLQMLEKCWELTEWLLVALIETSNPTLLPAAATPVGEERQIRRRRREEIEEGEEQLPDLRSMDGSALGSRIKHTIKHSIESTIKCILDCLDCGLTEKRQAIQFLLRLSLDMSTIVKDSESSRRVRWILLLIFCSTNNDDSEHRNKKCWDFDHGIRGLVCEKLSELLTEKHGELPSEETERVLQLIRLPLEDLNRAFHDVDITIRTHAVIIMEGLCAVQSRFPEVAKLLVDAIPKVVKETLIHCGSTTADMQEEAIDVEKGKVSQDNQDDCKESERLRKAFVSLCYYGYKSSSAIGSRFKEIASKICEEQGKSYDDFICLLLQFIKE